MSIEDEIERQRLFRKQEALCRYYETALNLAFAAAHPDLPTHLTKPVKAMMRSAARIIEKTLLADD